jgi:hypothetical protein
MNAAMQGGRARIKTGMIFHKASLHITVTHGTFSLRRFKQRIDNAIIKR